MMSDHPEQPPTPVPMTLSSPQPQVDDEEDPHDQDDGNSVTDFSGKGMTPLTEMEREEIAQKENQAVLCFRLIVLLTLAISCCFISYGVYVYMRDTETKEFETQFQSDAMKVMETLGQHLDDTFGACDAFLTNYMNQAQAVNATWPFVAPTNFAVQAAKFLKLAKGYSMRISPIVMPDQKDDWEVFVLDNLHWIHNAFDVMETDEDWNRPVNRDFITMPMFGFDGPVTQPAPWSLPLNENGTSGGAYAPSWVGYPVVPESFLGLPYNFDGWQPPSVAQQSGNSYHTRQITLSAEWGGLITNPNDPIHVQTIEAGWAFAQSLVPDGYNVKEPTGMAVIPMYDTLDTIRIDTTTPEKLEPVGYLSFTFFLKELLKDILPQSSKGVHIVMSSGCGINNTFTYQLDGRESTFLGSGDLHETKYDEYEYVTTFGQLMNQTSSTGSGSSSHYTGLPVDDTFCTKTMKIYPSQIMEDDYRTTAPLNTTFLAAGIFVFTTVVFLFYDCIVARRQKVVLTRALASGAIVNSMFPQTVRQALYDERKEQEKQAKQQQQQAGGGIVSMTSTMSSAVAAAVSDPTNENNAVATGGKPKGKPIANLFHETTIFFADLAGFTAWSSKRTPTEVFELLEALYGAFDLIAKRRAVFKVETIGDCYVAVTGIPNPQPDHAVIMVKFARDCMNKMRDVIEGLIDSLGVDTRELEMRIGLHSGSTTAGVLRGDKARFQLFGDTVNTTSRMESNGVKGRIHVSQATADALIVAGKKHWLTAREDKIVAKGKGVMQTYFVTFDTAKSARSSSTGLLSAMDDDDDDDKDEV